MRFEFDQTAMVITCEDYLDEPIKFHCTSYYQYRDLCKCLLSPSQQDKHLALSMDGIYHVSKKGLKAGIEYMKNNQYNRR